MSASDDFPFYPDHPAQPGFRWIEVHDGRLTNRIRWEQIPENATDPEPVNETPEEITRTRRLVADLVRTDPC
jgi:hypothetical protein